MFFDFKLESKNPEEEFEGDLSVAIRPSDPIVKKPSFESGAFFMILSSCLENTWTISYNFYCSTRASE